MKLLAQSCVKLTRLDLGRKKKLDCEADSAPSVFDFDDDGLCIVGSACIHLDDVNLKGRSRVGDVGVGSFVRSFKNLKFLSLKRCVNVTDESLKTIGEANCLKSLTLDGCFLITDLGLEFLANGGNVKNCLRHLSLSKCTPVGRMSHDYGVVAIAISQLPSIRSLQLSWLINVTDISLFQIARNCIKLNAIYLAGCKAITSRGLHAFAHHSTLESIDLSSCPNISWNDVERVAPTWMMIENLELSETIKTQMPEGVETKYCFCCTICWKD
ncbi:leucine-rich repeat, cysteine-containing subtype protein [Tanacetum coccineum]